MQAFVILVFVSIYYSLACYPHIQEGEVIMEEDNNIYSGFAYVYDRFMDNIPYDMWHSYIHGLLRDYNINNGIGVWPL